MTATVNHPDPDHTMFGFEPETYRYFNDTAPYLNIWVAAFVLFAVVRIALFIQSAGKVKIHNNLLGDAAGILLILNHSVCFIQSIVAKDVISTLLFAWWGPGFLVFVYIYLQVQRGALDFNWSKVGLITSLACKLCYLLFMAIYAWLGCYSIIYTFSLWIMHDQINQAWFHDNADRTRRTTEDYWIVRLLYPAGLFVPWFVEIPYGNVWGVLGVLVFLLWVFSMMRVTRRGYFNVRSEGNYLRDIVYLSSAEKRPAG